MPTYKKDCFYIRPYGSSGAYTELPYTVNSVKTLPPHSRAANDLDKDAYTNTKGRAVRNRIRHDVASLSFQVPTMTGQELKDLFTLTTNVWLDCYFFYEPSWAFVSKKMYRSGTVSYEVYYVNDSNPLKNIYNNVTFDFVEE